MKERLKKIWGVRKIFLAWKSLRNSHNLVEKLQKYIFDRNYKQTPLETPTRTEAHLLENLKRA